MFLDLTSLYNEPKKHQSSSKVQIICKTLDNDLVKHVLNNILVRELEKRKAKNGGRALPYGPITRLVADKLAQ